MKTGMVWLTCWLLCLVGSTRAQNAEPLTMSVDSPLSRIAPMETDAKQSAARPLAIVARFGRWFPVAVTFNNTGEAVQGTVSLQLTSTAQNSDMGPVTTWQSEVDLPANARKRVWLYARLERGECDGGRVSFSGRGFKAMARDFTLLAPDEGSRLLLTISDTEQRLNFLSGFDALRLRIPDPQGNYGGNPKFLPPSSGKYGKQKTIIPAGSRAVETLGAGREWVPTRWIGLESLDAVILGDFPHTALSNEQLDALRDYVAGGGTLVVLGGANWQRLGQSPLQTLWPLTPQSARTATGAETGQLVKVSVADPNSAADRLGGAPLIVTRGTVRSDAMRLTPELAPEMMAQRMVGAGRVLWLGFDPTRPPFLDWSGQENLWRRVLERTAEPARLRGVDARLESMGYVSDAQNYYGGEQSSGGDTTGALRTELVRSPQLRTPPASAIAWFLALYVFFLVPVNYVVLRAIDRRELAWVTVPVIVAVFSVLSYFAAVRIKGTQVRLRQVNIVQGSGGGNRARADAMLWLFSPRKTSYSVTGRDSENKPLPSMASAIYGDGARSDALEYAQSQQPDAGGPIEVRDAPINMWDFKTFVGQAIVPTGNGITVAQNGDAWNLVNRSGVDWSGAVWIKDGLAQRVGEMPNGKTVRVNRRGGERADASAIAGLSEMNEIFRFGQSTGENIAKATLNAATSGNPWQKSQNGAWIVAWSTRPVARLQAEGEAENGQDVTLWLWHLPNAR